MTADGFLAFRAFHLAVVTTKRSTDRAITDAGVAEITAARFALRTLIVVEFASTTGTVPSLPTIECDVGAAAVVGIEDLPHDQEEIRQPSLLQRVADGRASFSFTQRLIFDVRMRHVITTAWRLRIAGDNLVVQWCVREMQPDLERSQKHLFQFDRIGHGGEMSPAEIAADLGELVVERDEVAVDLGGTHHDRCVSIGIDRIAGAFDSDQQLRQRLPRVPPRNAHGALPMVGLRFANPSELGLAVRPGGFGKFRVSQPLMVLHETAT